MDDKLNLRGMVTTEATDSNATFFNQELEWLVKLISWRLRSYFGDASEGLLPDDIVAPAKEQFAGSYADFVVSNQLDIPQRIILAISLAPYISPELLDAFATKNSTYDKHFAEFGGNLPGNKAFIPTVETALFLLAGKDLTLRFQYYKLFGDDQFLVKSGVLVLESQGKDEAIFNTSLRVSPEYLEYFITGKTKAPAFGENFPAHRITTPLQWEDFVLAEKTRSDIEEIMQWIAYSGALMDTPVLGKRLKPGYRVLFHGPPGTGKTLAAMLIGKAAEREVYRIDLSMIVSRYVGETEKNLAKVFDRAESKQWILFFDEADALFGKRTDINSANDRFANQEVAYLLQRIEEHNGFVILATNLKDNIDKAFLRRFQSVVHFPLPGPAERLELWRKTFAGDMKLSEGIDWAKIAQDYTLSGAAIVNVAVYSYLQAMKNNVKEISFSYIEAGIKKELHKEGIII